eukprot:5024195-Alexandrium_andersonii.AAC.1
MSIKSQAPIRLRPNTQRKKARLPRPDAADQRGLPSTPRSAMLVSPALCDRCMTTCLWHWWKRSH